MLDPKKITKIKIKSGCGACEYTCRVESGDVVEAEAVKSFNKHKKKLRAMESNLEQCRFSSANESYLNSSDFHMKGFVFKMPDGTWGFVLESNVECMIEFPRQLKDTVTKKSGVFSQAFMNKVAPEKSPYGIEEKSPQQKPEMKTGTSTIYSAVSTQNYRGFSNL